MPACLVLALAIQVADAQQLPPVELRAEWAELGEVKFESWEIRSFTGWDEFGDGGSRGFNFESTTAGPFIVLAANPAYWSEEDRKEKRQVFFLIRKDRFHLITPGSAEEKKIISMLEKAAATLAGEGRTDPKLMKTLAERLHDRKYVVGIGKGF